MAAASNETLCWLAAAVAGRPVPVATADSGPSWSDGRTIYLAAALSVSQRRCAVVAHALLIAAGSLSPALRRPLAMRPALMRRYFALELHRAYQAHRDRVPAGFAAQAGLPVGPATSEDVQASLRLARDASVAVAELAAWLGMLRPLRLKTPAEAHQNATAGKKAPDTDEQRDRGLDEHDEEALEKLRSPLTRGFGIAEVLLRLLGYRRGLGVQSGQAEGPAALAQARGDQTGQGGDALSMGGRLRLVPRTLVNERDEAGVHRYPEWNRRRQCYQPDHVTLTEIVPLPDPGASVQPAVAALDVPGLRAALARVAVTFERIHRQPSGEDLDLDALIDMRVQQRAGFSPHENIYMASQHSRRDLAALVLLDISRSTADRGADGRTVLQRHAAIGQRIVQVLDALGDRTAYYGFQSWGRHRVRAIRLKAFGEQIAMTDERLRALVPAGLTRTGAALRHARQLLLADRHRQQRLIVLLTDGFAYDDHYEGADAHADCERALQEAAAQGVACVCVHVGTDQPDAQLKRLYGETAYLKIATEQQLATPLGRLIDGALQRAAIGPRDARSSRLLEPFDQKINTRLHGG